jgi:ATP-dependent RNA helicase DDX49/DBP8
MSFSELGLDGWVLDQVRAVGFKAPTDIQYHCIPPILEGRDCLGCSKTGSGKTAAFALPILQRLSEDPFGIFAVVLTPTRELAFQIGEQFRAFGKPVNLRDVVVVGGMDMMKQSLALAQHPHVVIATPGRLADHIKSTDTFSLKKIKFIVLDEADRLLEPSFQDDLSVIFDVLPQQRQTLLFSATLTESLENLKKLTTKPFFWESKDETATVEMLDQRYILIPHQVKDSYLIKLLNILHNEEEKTAIFFTHSCRDCQIYSMLFKHLEFPCVALHSLMSQSERLAALAKFKSNKVKILVATDVASRGLDIPAVEVVVNVNVPAAPKDYLHRVGRTARAGRGGLSVTMVTQYDVLRLKNIESYTKVTMGEYPIAESDVLKILNPVSVARRQMDLVCKSSMGCCFVPFIIRFCTC